MTGSLPSPAASSLSSSRVGGRCSALRGSAAQGPRPKGCGPKAASSAATGLPSTTSASRRRCPSASVTCSADSGRWAATSAARSILSALSGLAGWSAGSLAGSLPAGSPPAASASPSPAASVPSVTSVGPVPRASSDSSSRLRATTASATASVGASSPARACSTLPGAPARVASARKEEDGGAVRSGRATSRAATSRSGSAVRCTARSWVEAEGLIRTKIRPRPLADRVGGVRGPAYKRGSAPTSSASYSPSASSEESDFSLVLKTAPRDRPIAHPTGSHRNQGPGAATPIATPSMVP